MRILLLDNSGMINKQDDYYVYAKTGEFGKDLQNLGNDVTFYGQALPSSTNSISRYPIKKHGIKVIALKRKKNKILNYLSLYFFSIRPIMQADFVYVFYPSSFKFIPILAKFFGTKYGLYIRGMDDFKGALPHYLYRNSHIVLTVSDYFTNYVNNVVRSKRAHTIRPMIGYSEKDIIHSKKDRQNSNKFSLLYLGRMDRDKGIFELLHALKIVNEKSDQFNLTLVGNGLCINELKEETEKLNISNSVNFIGDVVDQNEIKNYYTLADVFILPTYHEGFPRTLYEAMIFGTPIITTFVGGISSVMKDQENCIEIKPRSVESIIKALEYTLSNYDRMIGFANNASDTVKNIFISRKHSHAEQLNFILKGL